MTYIIREDDISVLPLSVRSMNCMRRANVHTIGAMLDYPLEAWPSIRNMGAKSAAEIYKWIGALIDGSDEEYILVETLSPALAPSTDDLVVIPLGFYDANGIVVEDIPVETLPLTVRAKNSLKYGGIEFASQLVEKSFDDLLKLKNMGRQSAELVLKVIGDLTTSRPALAQSTNTSATEESPVRCASLANELFSYLGQSTAFWIREINSIIEAHPDAQEEFVVNKLYEQGAVKGIFKGRILLLLEENNAEISRRTLKAQCPKHLSGTPVLNEILLELEKDHLVSLSETTVAREYPSILDFVHLLPEGRTKDLLMCRLSGHTLGEAGSQFGITRERVRQITSKELKKRPRLREDRYIYLYETYDFSEADFKLAFDEPAATYAYLEMISANMRKDRKPIDEQLLADTTIPAVIRKQIERVVYKAYVVIDGTRVKKSKHDLAQYVIKRHCKGLTKFDDFFAAYQDLLEQLGLENEDSLQIEPRTYINTLNRSDFVLWNQWRSFRYYNINERDYDELLGTLNLSQYENTELSTLKFFKEYPALMAQYDIHDEYELHNLLKKIWPSDNPAVRFIRMPTIEIGVADRDEQVHALLLQLAPIAAEEFAAKYEEIYGIKAATVLANYMDSFDKYFYDGVYSISSNDLPPEQARRMQTVLTDDFYLIPEIKRLYLREFPTETASNINPYTLKTLGFRVYADNSGYVVKNHYSSAAAYFRELLTIDDVVDMREKNSSLYFIGSYTSELYGLRAAYEIIEYSPLCYINIRRLQDFGVNKEQLQEYCKAVATRYEQGEYFTLKSLRQDGFDHPLHDLGFDDWFYASILAEDRETFSYHRVGGTKLLTRGNKVAQFSQFLANLLEAHRKIDMFDLMSLLESRYDIVMNRNKLIEIIRGTELHYDAIMEAVYVDYDTYFEEI